MMGRMWRFGERCEPDSVPRPGEVDVNRKAVCPKCGRLIGVSRGGRYLPHKRVVAGSKDPS